MAADEWTGATPGHPMQARDRGSLNGELTTPPPCRVMALCDSLGCALPFHDQPPIIPDYLRQVLTGYFDLTQWAFDNPTLVNVCDWALRTCSS